MRDIIALLEHSEEVPAVLYHGTSASGWASISAMNALCWSEHNDETISFTSEPSVAEQFGEWAAKREGDDALVVIAFNGKLLSSRYALVQHADSGLIHGSEMEWRTEGVRAIHPIAPFILDHDVIALDDV